MTTTPMNINTFMSTAAALPVTHSVLVRGGHGIGKSQIIRQLADRLRTADKSLGEFTVIDRRLSQMTDGDMIGLPLLENDVTKFCPPDWYMEACRHPRVLFLDELNRATTEIMQASFQICLDRELNGYKLHPQTRVYAAINNDAIYNVNEMDPALLDRFFTVDLEPSPDEWIEYAKASSRVMEVLVDFITMGKSWLDVPKKYSPGDVTPSRRSWERLSDALRNAKVEDKPSDPLFYSICLGYVGTEAAIALTQFAQSQDMQVSGEDVVHKFSSVEKKLKKMGQEKLNATCERVYDYASANIKKFNKKESAAMRSFMEILPAELKISFFSKFMANGAQNRDLIISLYDAVGDFVLDVFGIKKDGPADQQAVIPDFLQKKEEAQNA